MKIKHICLALTVSAVCYGSGFRVPEQSGDSVALAATNIATSFGADAAYYNPANMATLSPEHHMTGSFSFIRASKLDFENKSNAYGPLNYNTSSRPNTFLLPTFHMVFPYINDRTRVGFSLTSPAGLTMKWRDPYPRSLSKLFTVLVIEAAPSISYEINDKLSIAGGVRMLYSKGEARNEVTGAAVNPRLPKDIIVAKRDIKGDSIDFGYNLALSYRPTSNLSFGAIYRSKINMTLKGDAQIQSKNLTGLPDYDGSASITVPLPAILTLATSYRYNDFTFLFAYDRTYWSALKEFDFNYAVENPAGGIFDRPVEKNWHDTNTFRFGLAYDYSEKLRLMAGFAIDEKATDNDKVRFELPDTKAYVYSLGGNYKVNEKLDIGVGFLYQDRQKRKVESSDDQVPFNNVVGTFKRSSITFANVSFNYRF
ncbi:outer membrane transporter (OMPP1/FadL/TodX family) [Campylobacter blaseri]|uniref:Aromatic hydrocarbon degradation protein n=1 Tax=Campylobacter blaseri TaxID=2042961 RepID=A0A2P8R0V7_9BACT|nr:outer membrane protein transport protein [Campylobacter blaseri]PSM52127.1 hypothetical protein CQ405_03460 [Campylobacter blaseri]PSM53893.1 hypothetical protein CRN67_03460 [Campylobacter blaseri]QKF85327.1 outer membrane transporter (OMPP1/FadL/TodX family) [Campylobacter blaseri]